MKKLLIMFLLISVFLLSACSLGRPLQLKEDNGLLTVKNENELRNLLKEEEKTNRWSFPGSARDDSADFDAAPESGNDSGSSDYTKTNVQVEGVDEGDVVKTDGRRIYSIDSDRLQVVEILDDGKMELVLFETISNYDNKGSDYYYYTYFTELYITNKYLVVIGQESYYHIYYQEDSADIDIPRFDSYTITTNIYTYDIETLEKVDQYQISGSALGTRLIDDNLYIFSNHYSYHFRNEDYDPRPWIKHNNEIEYFDYTDIKYLSDVNNRAITIITKVSLQESIEYDHNVFLGSIGWGQIYVNRNAIYFASNMNRYSFFGSTSYGKLISFIFDDDGNVSFGGDGTYSGRIHNQFWMDEYKGHMRIATTEGWGDNVKNRLYVFERQIKDEKYVLEAVGLIDEGLGKPRETIRSVLFNKDKATVVTFELIDPFYTIDLSDPKNPKIIGELEVPGFSVYQYPWTDDLIIGIGFESDGIGSTGIKLSLYDISDFENPIEVGTSLILSNKDGWAYSEALYNHRAIMIDKSRDTFGFSLWRYNWSSSYYNSMNEYLVFDVDENREKPIQIKHTVSHIGYFEDNPEIFKNNYWRYNFVIKRAVRIDEYLYVMSGEVITSHNLIGDFGLVDEVIFEAAK